jgi:hypothetical protein
VTRGRGGGGGGDDTIYNISTVATSETKTTWFITIVEYKIYCTYFRKVTATEILLINTISKMCFYTRCICFIICFTFRNCSCMGKKLTERQEGIAERVNLSPSNLLE